MNDQTEVAPSEATEEDVSEDTKGQEKDQPAEAKTESAEDPKGKDAPEEEAEEKSPSKSRHQRRKAEMERLRGELDEANSAAKDATDRLARIQEAAKATQPPNESDFKDYTDYLVALAAHQSVAALDKRETSALEDQATQAQEKVDQIQQLREQELNLAWAEQVEEAKGRYADWDQVANDPTLPVNDTMVSLIKGSDAAADVYYHLATNRAEAAKIYGMEPLDAARAIGAIEARMSLPKARTQTEAPDPINPVKPRSTPGAKAPEEMNAEEYRKWREGQ